MSKVSNFMEKYGYSYKSFFVALIIFPPAGLLIAWKIPDIPKVTRIILTIIGLLAPLLLLYFSGVGLSNLFSFFSG